MPPRTRSSTGSIKRVARYVESVDSMDIEPQVIPKARSSTKRTPRGKHESGSDSDFDMSQDGTESESSEEELTSSMDDHHSTNIAGVSSVDDFSVDADAVAPKPVRKRVSKKATFAPLPEDSILHDGKVNPFPESRLNMSSADIYESISSSVDRNPDAARIVVQFRTQYSALVSRYPEKVETLDNEMPNYLMYNLGLSGVVDISLFQTSSFMGLDKSKVTHHYNLIKSIARDLIKGDSGKSYITDPPATSTTIFKQYVPWWD